MVDLTSRQARELVWLCRQEEPVLVGDLAYRFHVSPRTIRNDIPQLERCAAGHHLQLKRKHGKGIHLVGTAGERGALLDALDKSGDRILSHDERCSVMTAVLLLRDSVTYQQLADICGVSRQTAIRDLAALGASLAKEGIQVKRHQGKGLSLDASERDIRHAFVQLLADNTCPDAISAVVDEQPDVLGCSAQAEALIDASKRALTLRFQDETYILTIVRFVLGRIRKQHIVDAAGVEQIGAGAECVEALERAISPFVAHKSERNYLAVLILSQRMGPRPSERERTEADAMSLEAERISRHLVKALAEYQQINNATMRDVVPMLTEHIRAALYRKQNNIRLHEDDLESYLRVTSPLILEFTNRTLEDCGVCFAQSEVTYIALYIASIFESSGGEELTPSVLFVCSFGLATSALLKSRLERLLFGCKLIGPMSLTEAADYLHEHEIDLVIAACDFMTTRVPVLLVNPLLTQGDIDNVKGYVNQLPYTKLSSRFVERYAEQRGERSFRRVSDFVNPDDIQVVDKCDAWDDAIRIAASPLVRRGIMEPRYVESMIRAVCELGTYMVLTPETAYVHAGIDDGIKDDCTAILISRTPIRFGVDRAKRVRSIVVLGIKHKDKSSLLSLASIFDKQENIELVRSPSLDVGAVEEMHD